MRHQRNRLFTAFVYGWALVGLIVATGSAQAKDRDGTKRDLGSKKTAKSPTVELFQAEKDGAIQIQLIPQSAKSATIIIHNRTKQPLHIALPKAFAGVPVLAQGGGDNVNVGGNNNRSSNTSVNQGFGGGLGGGGGFGGGGMGGGGFGGGGFFDVGPDKVGKLKVATVCLEHGKADPNPRVPYQLKPIDTFTKDAAVQEICAMLGRGELDQVTAQAAAWHLTDRLSWEELAAKIRVKHLNGATERWFNTSQLQRAVQAVTVAHQRSEASPESPSTDSHISPGEFLKGPQANTTN